MSRIEPVFGGINLEDISAPRCFEVEERLKKILKIPVFHDDQHGTAVVCLAALINALKVVGKDFANIRVAISGAGAAGIAVTKFLLSFGAKDVILCDSQGTIHREEQISTQPSRRLPGVTNPRKVKGTLADAMRSADVFLGLSVAGIVTLQMVKSMARDAIVFAMANPVPEIMPDLALKAGARVVATGRSDFPNQVNNVLGFPGIFTGRSGCAGERHKRSHEKGSITGDSQPGGEPISEEYIIPSPLDRRVVPAVAEAVAKAAMATGVALRPVDPKEVWSRATELVKQLERGICSNL